MSVLPRDHVYVVVHGAQSEIEPLFLHLGLHKGVLLDFPHGRVIHDEVLMQFGAV